MIETKEEQERVILVGVELQDTENFEMSMEELASLAKTAGANVVNHYYQKEINMIVNHLSDLVN